MHKKFTRIVYSFLILVLPIKLWAQHDRIQVLQQRLDSLSVNETGLKQSVQLAITGTSIQDYLIAMEQYE